MHDQVIRCHLNELRHTRTLPSFDSFKQFKLRPEYFALFAVRLVVVISFMLLGLADLTARRASKSIGCMLLELYRKARSLLPLATALA